MDILSALILGLVQGLTEFLPVSSSGHLVLMQHFLGFREPQLAFDVLVHVATLLAVVIYFRKDIGGMTLSVLPRSKDRDGRRWVLMIAVGTVPTALIGLAFEEQFEALFASPRIVAAMLWLTAVILLLSDRVTIKTGSEAVKLTWIRALTVGIAQGLAIIPGISRSGFTIATAIFSGIDPARAARFSFLLSIPAILGATLLEVGEIVMVESSQIPAFFVAFLAAFASGYLAIDLLMKMVIKRKLWKFSVYLGVVGLLSLILV
jgi:undecaprenyl-diphosphatase